MYVFCSLTYTPASWLTSIFQFAFRMEKTFIASLAFFFSSASELRPIKGSAATLSSMYSRWWLSMIGIGCLRFPSALLIKPFCPKTRRSPNVFRCILEHMVTAHVRVLWKVFLGNAKISQNSSREVNFPVHLLTAFQSFIGFILWGSTKNIRECGQQLQSSTSIPKMALLFLRLQMVTKARAFQVVETSDVVKSEQRDQPTAPSGAMCGLDLHPLHGGQQNLVQPRSLKHEDHPEVGLGRARCEYDEDLTPPIGPSEGLPQGICSTPNPMQKSTSWSRPQRAMMKVGTSMRSNWTM